MIVGFVGYIGSGKGTAGDILKEWNFKPLSFAGLVKDVASVMFNWPRHLLEGDTDESRAFRETEDAYWTKKMGRPFTPREALQKVGTECGRDVFHKDFWVLALESKIQKNENYVITDVRFPNEINWIHNQHGLVIELQRGKNPDWYDLLSRIVGDINKRHYMNDKGVHESEWAWVGEHRDALIHNDGTVDELKGSIKTVLTNSMGVATLDELINETYMMEKINEVI
jgi:hypothetical protein